MKTMTTEQFVQQCQVARLRGYPRYLVTDLIDIDPDGVHCITTNLLCESNGQAYIRCEVLLKLRDDETPHAVWLDIDVSTFNLLKRVEVGV